MHVFSPIGNMQKAFYLLRQTDIFTIFSVNGTNGIGTRKKFVPQVSSCRILSFTIYMWQVSLESSRDWNDVF